MSIRVIANGNPVDVDFRGAWNMPFKLRGRFTTDDKDLQEALEAHTLYPGMFEIMEQVEVPDPVVVEPDPEPVTEPTTDQLPEPVTEADTDKPAEMPHATSEDGTIQVSGITSAQKAKIYLNQNFEIPMSKLVNAEMVHEQARICNIEFPDWK